MPISLTQFCLEFTFFSVKFDCKTTRITSSISTTLFTADGGKTSKDGSLFTNMAQEFGLGKVSDIMRNLYSKV